MHGPDSLSPTHIWLIVGFGLACVTSMIFGLNLTLGTRRRLGHFFIWIPAALLVAAGTAAFILLSHH